MKLSFVKKLRAIIEEAAESLDDKDALEGAELFRTWDGTATYTAGQRVRYDGILYRCLQDHQAQAGWTPAAAPSLWARVLIEDPDTVPEWVQPGSTNPYMKGDRVSWKGKTWESVLDHNSYEPGVYGWEEDA